MNHLLHKFFLIAMILSAPITYSEENRAFKEKKAYSPETLSFEMGQTSVNIFAIGSKYGPLGSLVALDIIWGIYSLGIAGKATSAIVLESLRKDLSLKEKCYGIGYYMTYYPNALLFLGAHIFAGNFFLKKTFSEGSERIKREYEQKMERIEREGEQKIKSIKRESEQKIKSIKRESEQRQKAFAEERAKRRLEYEQEMERIKREGEQKMESIRGRKS